MFKIHQKNPKIQKIIDLKYQNFNLPTPNFQLLKNYNNFSMIVSIEIPSASAL